MKTLFNTVTVCVLLASVSASVLAANSYRYRDNDGNTHIGYSIPPEFIPNGYEIRNDRGWVIEVVPPKAELDKQMAENLAEVQKRRAFVLQREKDKMLLRHYSSAEDIERVRDRKLEEFNNFVAIQNGNIRAYKKRISELQTRAANIERAGRRIPNKILDNLKTLEKNIHDSETMIDAKLEEKAKVAAAFDKDIWRILELTGEAKAAHEAIKQKAASTPSAQTAQD